MCASALTKPLDLHKQVASKSVEIGKRDPVKRAVGLTHGSPSKPNAGPTVLTGYQQWQPTAGAGTALGG